MPDIDTSFFTKADPNALTQGMNLVNTQLNNRLLYTEGQRQHLGLVADQLGQIYDAVGSLSSMGPNVTYNDVATTAQNLVKLGVANPDQVSTLMAGISPNSTPAQLHQAINSAAARALSAHDMVETYIGKPMSVNVGGQTVSGVGNVRGFFPQTSMNNTLSPAEKAAQIPGGVTASGTPFNKPTIGVLNSEGYDDAGNPTGQSPSPANGVPGGAAGLRTSQNPGFGAPAGASPFAPAAVPASASSDYNPNAPLPNPQGGVLAQTPPGVQAKVAAAAQQYASDQTDTANFQSKNLMLNKAYQSLVRLGPEGTGPGKDQLNTVKSFLSAWGLPGADVQNLTDFAEAKKYLVANLLANGDTATNDKLAATSAANPSVDINNAAAQDIVATAIAQQRIGAARFRMAQAQGIDASQYPQWLSNQFTPNLDPRAYEFDLLSPKAKATLVNGMSDQEFTAFQSQLADAQRFGYVQAPGAAGGK